MEDRGEVGIERHVRTQFNPGPRDVESPNRAKIEVDARNTEAEVQAGEELESTRTDADTCRNIATGEPGDVECAADHGDDVIRR